ncbi:uncharacterized protein HaLaN_15367 [Haematococcus lacustris]|uniref:Uncharacterized protein n=1 Tax=Haematococcus lacustris TaxID=44745 RepID=A0A699ZI65_HAELA|nr:uncharacterized protein HaLaN_15367 [Haematococcus lacustris]
MKSLHSSKLIRSQVQHDSALIQARRNTQQWNENIKLDLQHLAAAIPAGTSQVAIHRHVAVTLATWDAVWGEYLHPKWTERRIRLYGVKEKVLKRYFKKLEEEAAMVSKQRWQHRGAAPAKGEEYPALGFKKLRDRAPKAQAQLPVAQ